MKNACLIGIALAGLTFVANTPTAFANGEAGPNPIYVVSVQGNTVQVCPQGPADRACPDGSGMLRQDTASGDVVQLDDFCAEDYLAHCYVDECVPKGTYVYGFASPYECCADCPRTDYFGVAEVDTDPPADCTRSAGNAAPTPTEAEVPWPSYDPQGAWPDVCDQAPADGATGSGDSGSDSSSGCGVRRGTRASIVGIHLFVAAVGAWLLGRRRKVR